MTGLATTVRSRGTTRAAGRARRSLPDGVRAAVLLAAAAAGCSPGPPAADPPPAITISTSHCGQGWDRPHPGTQTFQLHNSGTVSAEAYLVDPVSGAVYGEVEGLGPGTTRPLTATVGTGDYAFRCLLDGGGVLTGPTVRVGGGQQPAGPAAVPVTKSDLLGPAKDYQQRVAQGLDQLVGATDALRAAVHAGDLSAARAAWLPAHLAYERLGAAYGAFGDFDTRINGRPDDLPGGVTDPDFTGFHRLEHELWRGANSATPGAGSAAPGAGGAMPTAFADQLAEDVRALRADFADQQTDPADLGLRAHEILEDTLRFELTGVTDQGSGTSIATAGANLDGTRQVLDVLRPLLAVRYPQLSEVDEWLGRADQAVRAATRPDGGWTPVTALDPAAHQRLDAAFHQLVELLAPVATLCEPRRTP